MPLRRSARLAREVVGEAREQDLTFMAGSIAYSAFLSLLPLLLLLLVLASAVGSDLLTERVVSLARTHLSPAGEGLVVEALTDASDRAGASLVGVISLVWGMTRIFRGLDTAFDELYGVDRDGLPGTIVDGIVAFLAVGVAVVGTGFATAALALVEHPLVRVLNPLALVVALVVAFYPLYYVIPDADITSREALPGTIFAALGWVVLEAVFGLYVALVDAVSALGTLGAIIVLLIWLYASALVLLVGATVNVVLAGKHADDAGDAPDPAAVRA